MIPHGLTFVVWSCASSHRTFFTVAWWAERHSHQAGECQPQGPDLRRSKGLPKWLLREFGRRWLEADQRVRERRRRLLLEG